MKAALQESLPQTAMGTNDASANGVSRLFGLLEKLALPLGACVTVVAYFRYVAFASRRLWFDEIYTHTITVRPTLRDVWGALCRGPGLSTPPFLLCDARFVGLGAQRTGAAHAADHRSPGVLLVPFLFRRPEIGVCVTALRDDPGLVNELEFFAVMRDRMECWSEHAAWRWRRGTAQWRVRWRVRAAGPVGRTFIYLARRCSSSWGRTHTRLDRDLDIQYTGSTIFMFVPPFTTYYHFRTHLESYYKCKCPEATATLQR